MVSRKGLCFIMIGHNRSAQRTKFDRILYLANISKTAIFPVPSKLTPFTEDTVDRLAYLFPEITFFVTKAGIECSSDIDLDLKMITQEVRYNLAREKVRAEGHQNRAALHAALFK